MGKPVTRWTDTEGAKPFGFAPKKYPANFHTSLQYYHIRHTPVLILPSSMQLEYNIPYNQLFDITLL